MRVSQRLAAIAMAGALSLSLAVVASAAGAAKSSASRARGVISQAWLSRLNLTADQQTKVKAASDTYVADQEKAQSLATPQEKRQASRQARSTYQAALQVALTPAQQDQLKAMTAEAREFHALGPMGTQLVGLSLTSEQKDKIKTIAAKYQPDVQKLRDSLKDSSDKKTVRSQIRDLQQKMRDEAKAVLTPDQVARLQAEQGQQQAAR